MILIKTKIFKSGIFLIWKKRNNWFNDEKLYRIQSNWHEYNFFYINMNYLILAFEANTKTKLITQNINNCKPI